MTSKVVINILVGFIGNTPGTGPAALVATVAAGGTVVAKWAQWTHAEGPVLVVSDCYHQSVHSIR